MTTLLILIALAAALAAGGFWMLRQRLSGENPDPTFDDERALTDGEAAELERKIAPHLDRDKDET